MPAPVSNRSKVNTPEYRRAFLRMLRGGKPEELRDMGLTPHTSGGYLASESFLNTYLDFLRIYNPEREYGTVVPIGSNAEKLPVPDENGEAYWESEAQAAEESDDTFTAKYLKAFKISRFQKCTEEIVQDAEYDLETYLAKLFARTFARKERAAFQAGTGVGQPRGWIHVGQVAVTTAAATIDADEIQDLYYSLDPEYRERAIWRMHDNTTKEIRKLKDGNGQPIFQSAQAPSLPDMLMGRPIIPANHIPEVAAGAKVAAFGDFSHLWIGDRGIPAIQALVELYADKGLIAYRMVERVDCNLMKPEAVKILQMKA